MDDDELEEWAELLGIDPDEVEDLIEAGVELEPEFSAAELGDYLESLAEALDIDVSYLYDMFYGYAPSGGD